MKLKDAKIAYENNKMVQHTEEGNICNYISCFDDEETGVYLKHSHTFIPLEELQLFNVHDYAESCTSMKTDKNSELLEISLREDASLTYITSGRSFMLRDIVGIIDANNINANAVEIITLKSSAKGSGRELLKSFCDTYAESAIVLKAEPIYDTQEKYEEACVSGEFDKSLEKLIEYYKSNGFIDINNFIGYDSACAFIYGNKIGNQICEHVISI